MRYLLSMLSSLICLGLSAPTTHAASQDVRVILKARVAEWCEPGGGQFDPAGIIERDVTGDGEIDLILDHRSIRCDDPMAGGCGVRACLVQVYVRKNSTLKIEVHDLSQGIEIGKGNRPTLRLLSHEGQYSTLRWKAGKFRAQ